MTQRLLFIRDYELGVFSFTELCARYGSSRETGYATLARSRQEGRAGLADRSRRPHSSPRQTPAILIDQLVEVRRQQPDWGPKKLRWQLEQHAPQTRWPSPRTAGLWLQRRGLTPGRRRGRRSGHPGRPQTTATAPNTLWTIDFKGHSRTRDGRYCYPLTVADDYSRYLLGCQALLHPTGALVQGALVQGALVQGALAQGALAQPVLIRLFDEYGSEVCT